MTQVTDDAKKIQEESRKLYHKPHLLLSGPLKDMTAAGTGQKAEGKMGSGSVDPARKA